MSETVANLVFGVPANIKIALTGVAEGSATEVGFTEGGVKITPAMEYFHATADQAVGDVDIFLKKRNFVVEFIVAEPTLANYQKALGLPAASLAGNTLKVGNETTVTKYVLYINGPGPGADAATRKFSVWRCVPIGNPEVVHSREDKTMFAMTFAVLQDTSRTANEQFYHIDDSGADTTAPTVVITTPAEDGTVVKDALSPVVLTFTEAGQGMNEGTLIYGNTISILNTTTSNDVTLVAGTIVYENTGKTLTFTPTSNWTASDTLSITVTTGVEDMAGNPLATTYIGNFTVTV
ncbi:hypothetical protein LCGC14_2484410 [marine sediment metagenome]|uniref:SbsA Ig-like domain-containing protein n=1 Tax=marine sediment metagenome TaxID=412755 RepID=A0A0F9BUD6_9ZZZZ